MLNSLATLLTPGTPLIVSYGLGVDSTALLVGFWREGIRPDHILFADTGSEKEETYDYLVTIYPLQVWGWHRIECARQIELAGLPVPPKSSCFFCPAMKAHEVEALPVDKLRRIVIMEANASISLDTVVGLWRSKRMTDYIREKNLLSGAEIDRLWTKWSASERLITVKEIASEDVVLAA